MSQHKKVSILLTGATGFIGGAILEELLTNHRNKYEITAIVRNAVSRASNLKSLGVAHVLDFKGNDDTASITDAASRVDLVIHTGDSSDHVPSAQAIIDGLKKAKAAGKKGYYIHTSGTGVIADDSHGEYGGNDIFRDDDPDKINRLPDTSAHRDVDLLVSGADGQGGIKTVIVLPPRIYGIGRGPGNKITIQVPTLIKMAIQNMRAHYPGGGKGIWSNIHVADLARLYVVLLETWLNHPEKVETGRRGYVFAEDGTENTWSECVEIIGKILYQKGVIPSPEVSRLPEELIPVGRRIYMGLASNSRSRAIKARQWGWKPIERQRLLEAIPEEIDVILKEER